MGSTSVGKDAKEIGVPLSDKITNGCSYSGDYYIQDSKYLTENIDWDQYPLYIDRLSCGVENISDELRKKYYMWGVDGYAEVNCISLNPEAKCFQ